MRRYIFVQWGLAAIFLLVAEVVYSRVIDAEFYHVNHDFKSDSHAHAFNSKLSPSLGRMLSESQDSEKLFVAVYFRTAYEQEKSLHPRSHFTKPFTIDAAKVAERIGSQFTSDQNKPIKVFKHIPIFYMYADKKEIQRMSQYPGIDLISLDSAGGGALAQAIPQSNIDNLKQQFSLTGEGLEVAILDTGIDTDHPDFEGRILSQVCFADSCPNGSQSAEDDHSHGTHVASIIGGSGESSHQGGAPEIGFHIIKVLDSENRFSSTSLILTALDHAIENFSNLDFVNMSLSTDSLFTGFCDNSASWILGLRDAVSTLKNRGVMTFASTGNDANQTQIGAPACIEEVIAVGAIWDTSPAPFSGSSCVDNNPIAGQLACFSNVSSATDIVAAGSPITAARMGGGSTVKSGTSMATPLALSCAALIKSAFPHVEFVAVESALKSATEKTVSDESDNEYPVLDCLASYESIQSNELPSLSAQSPVNLNQYSTNDPVSFSATATDTKDGDISGNIEWRINGELIFSGASFSRNLALGSYQIEISITDSDQLSASKQLSISVVSDLKPELSITNPQNGASFEEEQSIQFQAAAQDPEDGDIGNNIIWLRNNAQVGTGKQISLTLPVGSHSIEAQVEDSASQLVTTSVTVSVSKQDTGGSGSGGGINTGMLFLLMSGLVFRLLVFNNGDKKDLVKN